MSISAKKGDLFSIKIEDGFCCLGVVAEKWKKELYLVLFVERFGESSDLSAIDVTSLTPIIASSSLDAKIWHGHWPIVCRDLDTSRIAQPIYKVEEPGGLVAESFDRKFRKRINKNISTKLNYRKGVAPIRLENAIKAYHGVSDWTPSFDELLYKNVEESNLALK